MLNELLEFEPGCDVDPINFQEETPLHFAVRCEEPELRALLVDSLLDAGADTRLRFTITPSLSFPVLIVSSGLKIRLAKWRWTTYIRMMRKLKLHSAAMRLSVASQRLTSHMVRVSWPHRKRTGTDL